jgi:DNA-binding XRE family transcriptional regulator
MAGRCLRHRSWVGPVNAIETGKYDPSLPLAFRMARLFGLPIEAIFTDTSGEG